MKKASLGDRGWEKRGRGKDDTGDVGRGEEILQNGLCKALV